MKKKTNKPASDKVQVTVLDPRRELPSQVRHPSWGEPSAPHFFIELGGRVALT